MEQINTNLSVEQRKQLLQIAKLGRLTSESIETLRNLIGETSDKSMTIEVVHCKKCLTCTEKELNS